MRIEAFGIGFSARAGGQLIVAAHWQEYAWSAEICLIPDNEAQGDFGVKISSVRGLHAEYIACLLASGLQAALQCSPQHQFWHWAFFRSLLAACWQ